MSIPQQVKETIIRRLVADSHQYQQPHEVLDRLVQYVWMFETHQVTDLDAEGQTLEIFQDDLYKTIWQWTRRDRSCWAWLASGRGWPVWFERHLLKELLSGDLWAGHV